VAAPLAIPAKSVQVNMDSPKVHHLVGWSGYGDPKRLQVIRSVAIYRGRDPRIATLCVEIFRKAGVKPRDYKGQAAALLAWVQDPKNVYYVNEPGERLQDPLYTLKVRYGDCDDLAILLCCMFESCRLSWKLVISGRDRRTGQKVRHIDGEPARQGCDWSHIYCMVGTPVFRPDTWYYCEPTLKVPLGWDVISGDASLLPEMGKELVKRSPNSRFARPNGVGAPPVKVPTPHIGFGQAGISASVASAVATELEDEASEPSSSNPKKEEGFTWSKVVPAVAIGVATSVISQLILDEVRESRKRQRAAREDQE